MIKNRIRDRNLKRRLSYGRALVATVTRLSVSFLIRLMSACVPKDPHLIVFVSNPDLSDNPRSLFDWLIASDEGKCWKLSWLLRRSEIPECSPNGRVAPVRYVRSESLRGLLTLLRARVIVTSHNQFASMITPRRQLLVSLGHGIYFKTMGYLKHRNHLSKRDRKRKERSLERLRKTVGIMVSTSITARTILAACYHVPGDRIPITGLPRTDELFVDRRQEVIEKFFPSTDIKKVFMYMPTHRYNEEGGLIEGKSFVDELIRSEALETLCRLLEELRAGIIVKLHPFEQEKAASLRESLSGSRLIIANNDDFGELSLYQVLSAVDCLVSDYSSVVFEYFCLDRPVIFASPDVEEYTQARGLPMGPYDEWAAGPKVASVEEFFRELRKVAEGGDEWKEARMRVRRILVEHCDGEASERVWNVIRERLAAS